jgi:hypothetical protein
MEKTQVFLPPPPLIHPNYLRLTGVVSTVKHVQNNLVKLGATIENLQPVDWRKSNISPPINQSRCGNCWAVSSTSTLTDKFIVEKNIPGLVLDAAITTQCIVPTGCGGGQYIDACKYFESNGVPKVEGNCKAIDALCYDDNSCSSIPSCQALQASCNDKQIFKAKQGSTKNLVIFNSDGTPNTDLTIAHIKTELTKGPVVAGFIVFPDFWINLI